MEKGKGSGRLGRDLTLVCCGGMGTQGYLLLLVLLIFLFLTLLLDFLFLALALLDLLADQLPVGVDADLPGLPAGHDVGLVDRLPALGLFLVDGLDRRPARLAGERVAHGTG